jgi:pyruvate formate lyase activating enzyme
MTSSTKSWDERVKPQGSELEKNKTCRVCGEKVEFLSRTLPICLDCLRSDQEIVWSVVEKVHRICRKPFGLVDKPPRDPSGILCSLCANQCQIPQGMSGYCGLRIHEDGGLQGASEEEGSVSGYHDGLPTNCVADWVCPGGMGTGYPKFSHVKGPEYGFNNLAVFYHGCSFDCLFCQNWTHREKISLRERIDPDQLVRAVDESTSCICYFGGDPTPQLPHALAVSKKALEKKRDKILRICWETNGSMSPRLLDEMISLSLPSGGCIKFDIKAWNEKVHHALCGVSNRQTKQNFERAAQWVGKRGEPPLLIASTLLVPGYIDEEEVRQISRWIASLDPTIPYALLAFYPQFFFNDLPVTSKEFALRCKEIAEAEGLQRVRTGNLHLLQ